MTPQLSTKRGQQLLNQVSTELGEGHSLSGWRLQGCRRLLLTSRLPLHVTSREWSAFHPKHTAVHLNQFGTVWFDTITEEQS